MSADMDADMDADIGEAVRAKMAALQDDLLAKVEANLSGDVLQTRSGALKASISAALTADASRASVTVGSAGVPYAAIQEYGGRTPPHDIVPVKSRALAFAGGFAARVHHPGSTIPARSYLGAALDALHDDITSGLKAAVLDALGAG